jgi:mono/diheme cytochrome c family protein
LKRLGKYLLITIVVLVVLLAVGISLTIGWRPILGPRARVVTNRKFERTPQRLERGRYIATALSGCMDCHSEHDWKASGAPFVSGMEGAGEVMPFEGLPGRVVASNLTSDLETGVGRWSDDELARAIREGVDREGHTIFPMMPYQHFRSMSDEDVASVVVFLRSLPAVHHQLPETEIIFPVKYLINNAPRPLTQPISSDAAKSSDLLKRGAYLVTLGGCSECHTPADRGRAIPGMDFAGGFPMIGPWGQVTSANITPDASGIGYYDEALFLQAMRTGYVKARALNSIMPFRFYRNLTDDDLKAIFAYLRTLKPVKHRVDNTEVATDCKLCRQKHGGGALN